MNQKTEKTADDYFEIAFECEENKDHDGAIENYSKAIGLNRDFTLAYFNRGNALKSKGKYSEATKDYDKAIELNPKDKDFYINRSIAFFNNGEFNKAFKDMWLTLKTLFK